MAEMLRLEDLRAGYGEAVVLDGISLDVEAGDSVAILGRNGMGKTTLLNTIMGLTSLHAGRVRWQGEDISRASAHLRAHAGLGWVPQERCIFPSLTVEENLSSVARPGAWNADKVFGLFPRLAAKRRNFGNQLSGGEQQMLAIGRALVTNPRLLLLDEPTEGLAPVIVQDLVRVIAELVGSGSLAVVIVEQHARLALSLSRRAVVLERGRIVHHGSSEGLRDDPELLARLLAVS